MSISIALAIKPVKHDPPLELSSFFGDNTLIPAVTASLFSRNQISMDRVVDTIGCTGCTNSLQRAINDVVARFVVLAYTHTLARVYTSDDTCMHTHLHSVREYICIAETRRPCKFNICAVMEWSCRSGGNRVCAYLTQMLKLSYALQYHGEA